MFLMRLGKRVQEVIETLGYQPSALARSLIRQRSYTLGVVISGLKHIGPSRTLSGITGAAEEAGYALLLKEIPHFEEKNIEPIFQAFLSRHVDGIIWAVPEISGNRSWIDQYMDLDIPVVYLTMESQENISVVSIDNYMGGRIAMSHLIEQGYRNIGHISGPLVWWEARQRFAAGKIPCSRPNIDLKMTIGPRGIGHPQAAYQQLKDFLSNIPKWMQFLLATIKWHWLFYNWPINEEYVFPRISVLLGSIISQSLPTFCLH